MEHRVSNSQLEELLDYLMEHQSLAKGVGLGRSKETVDRQWEELAFKLNAHGRGASKTGYRWKRYWADLKHKVKARASAQKRDASGTGGRKDYLSDTDKKVLAIIGDGAMQAPPASDGSDRSQGSQLPRLNTDSPVSRLRSRNSIRSRKILDNRACQRMEPSLIVDLERKRINAEQKLADAAMIIAEAMRAQTEIARSQLAVTNNLAQALREQADIIKSFLVNK